MATTRKKPAPKKAAKKDPPIKLDVIYHRCDKEQAQLLSKIRQITGHKANTKAIFSVLLNYEETRTELKDQEEQIQSLKSELRQYRKFGMQVKEWISFFGNKKLIDLMPDHNDDDDDYDNDDWDPDDDEDPDND